MNDIPELPGRKETGENILTCLPVDSHDDHKFDSQAEFCPQQMEVQQGCPGNRDNNNSELSRKIFLWLSGKNIAIFFFVIIKNKWRKKCHRKVKMLELSSAGF
jgi:hypothetical protein